MKGRGGRAARGSGHEDFACEIQTLKVHSIVPSKVVKGAAAETGSIEQRNVIAVSGKCAKFHVSLQLHLVVWQSTLERQRACLYETQNVSIVA